MNKKICLVSPSLKMGGIERELVVLANFFASQGYKVTFISCLRGERFYSLHSEVKVVEPGFGHKGGSWNGLIFYPRLSVFIRNQVKKNHPDAVLTLGDWFNPIVLFSLWGTKYSVFIRDSTCPDYKFRFPIPLMKRWFYPFSAGFIAQTERAAEYKRKHFGKKLNIRVIPNAIKEVKAFPEIDREKIILYVGRFAWEKGPERLIRAYAALEDRQGWKLLMAGSGPLLKPMQALAKQLNLGDEVVFAGKVEDVDLLYSRAGIYVIPSVLEGFPNSLCEAMAAGLPVVCFDSIPWEEILNPGKSGLVVKNNDIAGLTKTLQELISNKDLRKYLGQNALYIKDRLSAEKIGAMFAEFIFSK